MNNLRLSLAKGINNVDDDFELGDTLDDGNAPLVIDSLAVANNVDIDTLNLGHLRRGRVQRLASTQPHSLFVSPFDDSVAWFVSGSVLYRLNTNYSGSSLYTLGTNNRMCFEVVNSEVVATNGVDIGWVGANSFTPFTRTTLRDFEEVMPAGQYAAFYRGTLYVASGSVIYRSKPWDVEVRDTRYSVIPMNGHIRMLAAVEDGLWVATDKAVAWIGGLGDGELTYVHKSDFVPADGCFGKGHERAGETDEMVVYWASNGFYTGKAGGVIKNHSERRVRLPSGSSGSCFRRAHRGWYQYIAVINDTEAANIYTKDTIPQYQGMFNISHRLTLPIISLSADGEET